MTLFSIRIRGEEGTRLRYCYGFPEPVCPLNLVPYLEKDINYPVWGGGGRERAHDGTVLGPKRGKVFGQFKTLQSDELHGL